MREKNVVVIMKISALNFSLSMCHCCCVNCLLLFSFHFRRMSNEGRITHQSGELRRSLSIQTSIVAWKKWDEQKERKTFRRLFCVFCVCFCLFIKLQCISSLLLLITWLHLLNFFSTLRHAHFFLLFLSFLTTKNERRGMSRVELDFVQDEMQPDWMWKRNKNLFSPFFKLCMYTQ